VKLPKTFLAVNLSEAFTFEELERQASDSEALEMKATPSKDLLTSPPAAASAPGAHVDSANTVEGEETAKPAS
jgi:hypothetical protein